MSRCASDSRLWQSHRARCQDAPRVRRSQYWLVSRAPNGSHRECGWASSAATTQEGALPEVVFARAAGSRAERSWRGAVAEPAYWPKRRFPFSRLGDQAATAAARRLVKRTALRQSRSLSASWSQGTGIDRTRSSRRGGSKVNRRPATRGIACHDESPKSHVGHTLAMHRHEQNATDRPGCT